ncbi:Uncharacterized protein Fot_04579 [Forsythia ovata]|uniref:Uncharacterized protein n=1 Tax=Forsythia ovata TaxID=205694 RepID=A0ABD1XDT1_9LAMI
MTSNFELINFLTNVSVQGAEKANVTSLLTFPIFIIPVEESTFNPLKRKENPHSEKKRKTPESVVSADSKLGTLVSRFMSDKSLGGCIEAGQEIREILAEIKILGSIGLQTKYETK